MSAARHAVFVEGVAGLLTKAEQIESAESDPKHPNIELIRAKSEAAKAIPIYRAAIYPADE